MRYTIYLLCFCNLLFLSTSIAEVVEHADWTATFFYDSHKNKDKDKHKLPVVPEPEYYGALMMTFVFGYYICRRRNRD